MVKCNKLQSEGMLNIWADFKLSKQNQKEVETCKQILDYRLIKIVWTSENVRNCDVWMTS